VKDSAIFQVVYSQDNL